MLIQKIGMLILDVLEFSNTKKPELFTFYILMIIEHWILLQKYNQPLNIIFHA